MRSQKLVLSALMMLAIFFINCSDKEVIKEIENESIPKGSIKVTLGTLPKTFDENITVEKNGTTLSVRAEDASANNWVSFEIEESTTGDNVISNFKIFVLSKEFVVASDIDDAFTSSIVTNTNKTIEGSFWGTVKSSDNAYLNLTSGRINLNF